MKVDNISRDYYITKMGTYFSCPDKLDAGETHVLVVGGGYGGMCCAASLKQLQIPFTLVDPKAFFHHTVGALRAAVQPGEILTIAVFFYKTTSFLCFKDYGNNVAIEFAKTFGENFIQGEVVDVDFSAKEAVIDEKVTSETRTVKFTYVVFATGSSGTTPCRTDSTTKAALLQEYRQMSEKVNPAHLTCTKRCSRLF